LECIRQVDKGKHKKQDPDDMIIPQGFFDNILDNAKSNKKSLSKKTVHVGRNKGHEYVRYGVAGPSHTTDPIVVFSDEETKNNNKKKNKKHQKKQNRKWERSPSPTSSESDTDDKPNVQNVHRRVKYLYVADLSKSLRNGLRVSNLVDLSKNLHKGLHVSNLVCFVF
jgi:hypothetical protein